MLFSRTKKQNSDICYNEDESGKYYAKKKTSKTRKTALMHDFTYTKCPEQANPERESRFVAAKDGGTGEGATGQRARGCQIAS